MQDTVKTARLWLGIGPTLLAGALIFHGPPDPELAVQLHHVAEGHGRWAIVHWSAAIALFLMSGAGFLVLFGRAAGEPVTGHPGAWMVFSLGALLTFSTAVAEASVVSVAAGTGDQSTFNTWWAFSGGMANGFVALAIATGSIALADLREGASRLPAWASMIGIAAGFLSAAGWALEEWLGIAIGGPIWLVSTLVMCLWLTLFGFMSRSAAGDARPATV